MSKYVFCIVFHVFAFYYICSIVECNNHVVSVSDSVLLNCITNRSDWADGARWMKENRVLSINTIMLRDQYVWNMNVFSNYSLYISPVTLDHEGFYQCVNGYEIATEHILVVQVPPRIVMSINGSEYNTSTQDKTLYVWTGEEVFVSCKASGAKPAANLTILINNKRLNPSQADTVILVRNIKENRTFDSVVDMKIRLPERIGNIICASSGQDGIPGQEVTVHYQNISFDLFLTLNGQQSDDVIYVDDKDEILAECYAEETMLSINFDWLVKGRHIDMPRVSSRKIRVDETFYSKSAMQYKENELNGTIACKVELEGTGLIREITQNFYIYVAPKVRLMINGQDCKNGTLITSQHEVIGATCHAIGARPAVQLLWSVNDELIEGTNNVYNRRGPNMTKDFITTLSIRPKENKGDITCHIKGHPAGNTYLRAKYRINGAGDFRFLLAVQHRMSVSIVISSAIFLFSYLTY